MTKQRYRSPALRSLHEVAEDLHSVGAIDAEKMRQFDNGCLLPSQSQSPKESKKNRSRSGKTK
jgi:DNA-binding transcriptional regulator YiaG